jgi:uncharacterized membrane protein YdjX (TVP38/TMEM64 family)
MRLVPERTLRRADALIGDTGWEIALALRLIPFISFNLVNLALGLTDVPWSTFLWTTGVGVLPVEVAMVTIGYGAAGRTGALLWGFLALAVITAAGLVVRRRVASGKRAMVRRARAIIDQE